MKSGIVTAALLVALAATQAVAAGEPAKSPEEQYEMKTYYLGLIYRGEKWTPDATEEVMELQKAHLANIGRLAETGELLLAGPMGGDTDLRGIFIFEVESMEKARELVKTDPAVKAGRLRVDLYPWYAVKGITYPGKPAGKGN